MAAFDCGKMLSNPKKQVQFTGNGGESQAKERQRTNQLRLRRVPAKLLKSCKLFSKTFSLTRFPPEPSMQPRKF